MPGGIAQGVTSNFGAPQGTTQNNNNANPTSMFGNPNTFTAAANTQASDYDNIMKSYSNIANQSPISTTAISPSNIQAPTSIAPSFQTNSAPTTAAQTSNPNAVQAQALNTPGNVSAQNVTSTNLTPQQANYQQSGDVTKSLADLSNLATTGGYTAQGIQDIRARDIAPTRSIYAGAQQNINQSRALGGGYSPNAVAAQAQLARGESSDISNQTIAANAGIAQNVAANQIQASGMYSGAADTANAATQQAGEFNANTVNQINEANAQANMQAQLANQQNQTQTGEYNTSMAANINQANVQNQMQTGEFNTQAQQQNAQENAARQQQTGQFNTSTQNAINAQNAQMANQTNQYNQQAGMRVNELNQQNQTQTNEFNTNAALQAAQANRQAQLQATSGQANLYGTTPALTNMFGNQVMQANNANMGQQQINQQRQQRLMGI